MLNRGVILFIIFLIWKVRCDNISSFIYLFLNFLYLDIYLINYYLFLFHLIITYIFGQLELDIELVTLAWVGGEIFFKILLFLGILL